MNEELLKELNKFLGKAALSTYAGGGNEVDPQGAGFNELKYDEGKWNYTDSYTGFFQSWGRETVWYNKKPFWTQIYGGGMTKKFQGDLKLAHETFGFLKKALSAGEKKEKFQPRGPKTFADGNWSYTCDWSGDISKFEGHEKIMLKGEIVFAHDFLGGLIVDK
jgi:hypothetical protein